MDYPTLARSLAEQCLTAEREAHERAGPAGLERASFLLRIQGLPNNAGPLVELWPGLRGTVELWANPTSTVRVRCSEVRMFLHLHMSQGAPRVEVGVDPLRLVTDVLQGVPTTEVLRP